MRNNTPHDNSVFSFFTFTRRERRGLMVYCVILCLVWASCQYIVYHLNTPVSPSDLLWSPDLEPEMAIEIESDEGEHGLTDEHATIRAVKIPFSFNPNELGYDSLLLAGFSPKAAKNLLSYRANGGIVRNLKKLKSIYGVDTSWLQSMVGYIRFPSETQPASKLVSSEAAYREPGFLKKQAGTSPALVVELNTADSLALLGIKGIGPALCRRILHMRRRLGGFLDLNQLKEFQVLPDTVFDRIQPFLWVDAGEVKPIDLNEADYAAFQRHPLFDNQTIKAILQYRKQHGPFLDVLHIRRIRSLDAQRGEKIIPYLKVAR